MAWLALAGLGFAELALAGLALAGLGFAGLALSGLALSELAMSELGFAAAGEVIAKLVLLGELVGADAERAAVGSREEGLLAYFAEFALAAAAGRCYWFFDPWLVLVFAHNLGDSLLDLLLPEECVVDVAGGVAAVSAAVEAVDVVQTEVELLCTCCLLRCLL